MRLLLLGVWLLFPLTTNAAVLVNEIMYDPEGTDSGREWIEVVNDGLGSVDLSVYRLFENEVNHKLTLIQGSNQVGAQGFAVIADNAAQFLSEHPGFTGALFDSAFSLNNSGESLSLKDGDAVVSTVNYTSQAGGTGDGTTLQRFEAGFKASFPTPGQQNIESVVVEEEEEQEGNSADDDDNRQTRIIAFASASPRESIVVYAGKDRHMVAGAAAFFEAQAYKGVGKEQNATIYRWNFGNGEMARGKRVLYQYNYPGTYVAWVKAEAPGNRTAEARFSVTVEPAQLSLDAGDAQAVTLTNSSAHELDLGFWSLRFGTEHYLFPQKTILLPRSSVSFARSLTGFKATPEDTIELVYPNGKTAVSYQKGTSTLLPPDPKSERLLPSFPDPVEDEATTVSETPAVLAAAVPLALPEDVKGTSLYPWLAALGALLLIALGLLLFLRSKTSAESFVIIEEDTEAKS